MSPAKFGLGGAYVLTLMQYFQLKKWSSSQQSDWLSKHVGPYTSYESLCVDRHSLPFDKMLM